MNTANTDNTVLVLGATGGIGGELARQLQRAGWKVRAMKRRGGARPGMATATADGIDWCHGDALERRDVEAATEGCAVIVHAVNPPGYRNWAKLVLPMLDNSLAAAKRNGATLVLPGTVYNYGPDAFALLSEDSPQEPHTRKGAIRVELELRLRDYARHGGRVLIVRAGDFFGPNARNSWFSQGLIRPNRAVTKISNPGMAGVGHQWAYLPDVARTMLLLLERRDTLEPFARFHMAGHWDADGTEMARAILSVVARHNGSHGHGNCVPEIGAFPWWLIRLLAPFKATLRELLEMRYLWQRPLQMDNSKLKAVLGQEPQTPLEEAIATTLRSLNCLP
ncbi:NAD-dependent epimerase/dehydratase family protein [Shewanella sp. AS16]|uniref:NAD-dependent epimerase/dehydratase family protein n=1 Tax=Shewanella sp. AS16 TaxID=2907625 RepID=UPI001F3C19FC|nr:NAD-dependent epimerase/dehydratase family protein [Shewanella sp. AS16]MCE9685021.1 NAD-dependent epimerase/dehydratase family protein [Shewanella sp. AS16]